MEAKVFFVSLLLLFIYKTVESSDGVCPDLDSPHHQHYYIKDNNGTQEKHRICAWLFSNQNCAKKTFIMIKNETITSFIERMDEISGHPWKFPGDYWFSRRDVPYTESIFLNKNCTFIGHDDEYLKGDTVERRYNDRNSTVPFNFPTHNKFLSATCTCTNVEENESASNGTGTEIETFFEDLIEVKTEQIVTPTSSTRPFCVGMLLGVILTVGLYGLYTYRDQFVPLINRVRNGASRIHTPSYNNPLYMNGNNEHLQGLNSHSYHI